MIEAEIKARLADPGAVTRALDNLSSGVVETYSDTYYDTVDSRLDECGQELRIRTVTSANSVRNILTFKAAPADLETNSKPEYEVLISNDATMRIILEALGFVTTVRFTKECVNYEILHGDRRFLATLVTVREIEGVFLEVETQTTETDLPQALHSVRQIMATVGVTPSEFTVDTYTAAVQAANSGR